MASKNLPHESYISSTTSPSAPSQNQDTIHITNLQLPYGLTAPDIWLQPKPQPGLISLSLHLQGTGFSSASDTDKLDASTIHYGILAKKIRAESQEGQTVAELEERIQDVILEIGRKEGGKFIVARSVVEVDLVKASMFGERVRLGIVRGYDKKGRVVDARTMFHVKDVKIMTLVGVNTYERSTKQPLVASLTLHLGSEGQTTGLRGMDVLFTLEQTLVQIIQDTSFETLETLIEFTYVQLRKQVLDNTLPGVRLQLRIEKPRAIAFADAPVVEITREVPSKRSTRNINSDRTQQLAGDSSSSCAINRLSIIKPYSG